MCCALMVTDSRDVCLALQHEHRIESTACLQQLASPGGLLCCQGLSGNVDSQALDECAHAADDNGLQSKASQYTSPSAYNKVALISGPACTMAIACADHRNPCSMTTTVQSVVLGKGTSTGDSPCNPR